MRRRKRGNSVANLVYKRVSTDQQSIARQDLVLDEAGIEDPVVFEEDPGTSSRLHPLQRPKFGELLDLRAAGRHRAHLRDVPPRARQPAHPRCARSPAPRPARPAHPRWRVLRHGPHRPPPAHGRAGVHREVHGADPRRRRRTPTRPPARADVRRTTRRRGQRQPFVVHVAYADGGEERLPPARSSTPPAPGTPPAPPAATDSPSWASARRSTASPTAFPTCRTRPSAPATRASARRRRLRRLRLHRARQPRRPRRPGPSRGRERHEERMDPAPPHLRFHLRRRRSGPASGAPPGPPSTRVTRTPSRASAPRRSRVTATVAWS